MNHYLITLIHGGKRIVRNVIAHSSMEATCIGIRMMPRINAPMAVICNPAGVTR